MQTTVSVFVPVVVRTTQPDDIARTVKSVGASLRGRGKIHIIADGPCPVFAEHVTQVEGIHDEGGVSLVFEGLRRFNEKIGSVHVVKPSAIVMPDFYTTMSSTLGYARADFAFCHCLSLGEGAGRIVDKVMALNILSTLMVQRWVFDEVGIPSAKEVDEASLRRLYNSVVELYKGVEVPVVLTIE